MQRVPCRPRPQWRAEVEALGLSFHTVAGRPYWTEDAAYVFTEAQIDALEAATQDLHDMALEIVAAVVGRGDYAQLGIGETAAALIDTSWRRREPSLYGRMDFVYDGLRPPQLLEYNADTPTALFEAAVVQWVWLQAQRAAPGAQDHDQFNSIHEKLIAAWPTAAGDDAQAGVHFACVSGHDEDRVNTDYLRDTAIQAGLRTVPLDIADIGWLHGRFVDAADQPIARLFKLYPWEWLCTEPFAAHLQAASTRWIEPPWKLILSNKSILSLLWQRFRGHPNLLPAAADAAALQGPLVRKPRFGREGEGVALLDAAAYDVERPALPPPQAWNAWVYQAQRRLPECAGRYPVIGSWVIGGRAAGIGIREDAQAITRDTSGFVPHYFR